MQVTAKGDYAVRAMLELAVRIAGPATRDEVAEAQDIPPRYLEAILGQLRQAGLVTGHRGAAGGYTLGRSADEISVAEVLRAVDGPLALVQGERPENVSYDGVGGDHLVELWIGLRAAVRRVLDEVTIADVVAGDLPEEVRALVEEPDAWQSR